MRKPETREFWEKERDFIEAEAKSPNPMAFLREYVRMQANFCMKDGHDGLAREMAAIVGYELDEVAHQRWLRNL